MGGLRKKMPITFWTFLIATLAISGVPLLSGFYSKDGILGSVLAFGMLKGHYLPFILGITAAMLTPFYMFRIVFLTFFGQPRDHHKFEHAHESGRAMTIPLVVLAVMSVIAAGIPGNTADKSWFRKFAAPYDVPAIAAEYQARHAEPVVVAHHVAEPGAAPAGEAHAAPETPETPETHAASHEAGHEAEAGHVQAMAADDGHGHSEPAHSEPAHSEPMHGAPIHGEAAHAEPAHGAAAAHGAGHGGHDEHAAHVHHTAHIRAMIMSILAATIGISASWWTYHRRRVNPGALQARLPGAHKVLQGQYFFDELYAATLYRFTLWWSAVCAAFDRIVIDGIVNGTGYLTRMVSWVSGLCDRYIVDGAVNGVAAVLQSTGEDFRRVQTGRVQTYLVYVSASVLVLIVIYRVL